MNKPAWLINLIPLFMSLVIIRTYLGSFDNVSLFAENLSGSGIFNFVFIFMMLTLAAFAVISSFPRLSSVFLCLKILQPPLTTVT